MIINCAVPKVKLPVRASQYYVDANSGSDSNPGTLASPFLTIQHAVYQKRKRQKKRGKNKKEKEKS